MDRIVEVIIQSYGLLGILILAPLFVCVWLGRTYVRREKMYAIELKTVHEARVADAQKVVDKLMELAAEQSSLNKETNLLLTNINAVLERIARGG